MKKFIAMFLLISTSALLTACASSAPYWYQEGVSRKDTRSYYQECIYNVEMNKVSAEREKRLIRACMEKAGFRLVR